MPQNPWLVSRTSLQRDSDVALAIDSGEDDDAGFHGEDSETRADDWLMTICAMCSEPNIPVR
jgi:hypothetical protein